MYITTFQINSKNQVIVGGYVIKNNKNYFASILFIK